MKPKTVPDRPAPVQTRPQPVPTSTPAGGQSSDSGAAPEMSSAEFFRIYRSLPLDVVLEKLGATPNETRDRWQFKNALMINIAGEPGSQTWKNEAEGSKPQRGAIDLVVFVRNFRGPGQALAWLKSEIPNAAELVASQPAPVRPAAPSNAPAARPAPAPRRAFGAQPPTGEEVGGGVRREPKAEAQRLSKEESAKIWERYDSLMIGEVFERLGAELRNGKWNIDDKKFIFKEQRWQDVFNEGAQGAKGGGAIGLVMYVKGLEDRFESRQWLINQFGENFGDELLAESLGPRENRDFSPPERIPEADAGVRDYLVSKRVLPSALVDEVMKQGNVYGTHPWYEKERRYLDFITRCVFLGPASAELRDTDPDGFKGCCDGSQTDGSGFSVRPAAPISEKILGIGEAAIDALSYRALFPGRASFSPNGAGRFVLMLRMTLEALSFGFGVRLSTDADDAGDIAAQKIFNALYCRRVLSKKLGVEEELVEKWFLDGDLSFTVQRSPHQLFFNKGWQAELPVFERVAGMGPAEEDDDGLDATDEKPKWVDSGNVSPPIIQLRVGKDLHEKLRRGTFNIPVSDRGFDYVVQSLNVARDRPVLGKDWNDVLKRLGMAYSLEYDRRAARNFADGPPPLPAPLEAFRQKRPPVAAQQAPAPSPNSPSADADRGGHPAPAPSSRPNGMRPR